MPTELTGLAYELDQLVRAQRDLAREPLTPANEYMRRLLAEREFALRTTLDQPILDPREDEAVEALSDGAYRRRRLPTADQQA